MFKYSAFDLNIHSEIFLPELISAGFNNPDLNIRVGSVDLYSEKPVMEGRNFKVTESAIYKFWKEIGKFKIVNGSEIIVDPSKTISQRILRSFILGTVFASVLYQRGLLVLHASAVNMNNNAVAFLGSKGLGKSTTAMTFYNKGYSVLADDYIAIDLENEIPLVYPGFPSLRLSHKSRIYGGFNSDKIYYNDYEIDKIHVPAVNEFSNNKIPLKHIYVLNRGINLKIIDLDPQKALMNLVKNTFHISKFKKHDFKLNLSQCAQILEHTNISLLEVPDSLEEMYKAVDLVKADIN